MTAEATPDTQASDPSESGALSVFRNTGFLRLWLSQASTQIGGNMVLFGLTVIVVKSTSSNTAVSLLILSFLVPAVLFSAVAGVYVDRIDRRLILIATNLMRGLAFVALYLVGVNFALIILLNIFVSTVTVFFAPAELAMIGILVPRRQLLAASGIFTLTLNAAFALGFALLGPLVVKLAGAPTVILVVAGLYFLAAVFCITLPASPPPPPTEADRRSALGVGEAEHAVQSTLTELREGFSFIRNNRSIGWSLVYLAITASLVGVLGVLGPAFARETLGLAAEDFVVVVLPLGFGIVTGILLLNSYGRYFPRRRVIEGGLIILGILLAALSAAGPISRFLQGADTGGLDLSGVTSLLSVVVGIAFFAGIAYGLVAIPAQTQLQEDLPEDVRGRVFGVLGMLVSVASFLPIILVGPISDLIGTTAVIFVSALTVLIIGIISVVTRGPLQPSDARPAADPNAVDPIAAALHADRPSWREPASVAPVAGPIPAVVPQRTGPSDPTDRD